MQNPRLALVTGSNRGIGLEICRQLAVAGLSVILTARDEEKGWESQRSLQAEGLDTDCCVLDVDQQQSVEDLRCFVEDRYGRLDVLVNNAAISLDNRLTIEETEVEIFRRTFETNLYGPIRLFRAFLPLMRESGYGRVVNVSSGRGSFHKLVAGNAAYRISKTALNGLTVIQADETKGTNILVNAMTPGWVRTKLGGIHAPRSLEEGADTAVWLATLPDDGPTGKFFRDRKEFPW